MDMDIRAISVDDERPNLLLIEAMAEDIDLQVSSFLSPQDALEYLAENDVDIAFVDYMMPEIDGIEFIKRLRKINPDIPVVMITALGDDNELKLRAIESGATEFLNKPLNMPEFRARVANLMELRKSHLLIRNRAMLLEEEVKLATVNILLREHETLEVLGRVAGFKDMETGAHIARVSHYSRLIAISIGLSDKDVDLIFNAAPLHDIGKIGVPDAILTKPSKLTDDEFKYIIYHPRIGYDILKNEQSPFLQAGARISLYHHEKYDGTGYPMKLKGEDIHLYGRIVAVSDVFDALSSERPYKEAWPEEKVLQYLQDQKGKHFDPTLIGHYSK